MAKLPWSGTFCKREPICPSSVVDQDGLTLSSALRQSRVSRAAMTASFVMSATMRWTSSPVAAQGLVLPEVAAGRAEVDCFDFIADLKIAGGPLVCVLTGKSLHGALTDAWVLNKLRAQGSMPCLLGRWQRDGLPAYAQFDNDAAFQGAHQHPEGGAISRLVCAGDHSGIRATLGTRG